MHHGNTEVRLTAHSAARAHAGSRKRHYHAHLIVVISCCNAYARHGAFSLYLLASSADTYGGGQ